MTIVRHTFDPKVDAAYCYVGSGRIADTEEVADGIIVDRDAEGQLVGVEVLDVTRRVAGGDLGSFLTGLVEGLFARRLEAAE